MLLLVTFLFYVKTHASTVHGVLMVVKGDVTVISSKDQKSTKAKIGTKVFPGDTIETKKEARAKLVMVDKNIINISPDSKFQLEKYEYNAQTNKKGAILNVIYGKVRATVSQKYDGEENRFQVKTKSSVAGVRGTDFMVSFSETTHTAKVVTFEGRVEVGQGVDATGRIQNPVTVDPGQFTVANVNAPPSLPAAVPQEEFKSLSQSTVAETPDTGSAGDGDRTPSQSPDGEKKENSREPNSTSPSSGANNPPPPQGGVLDEMGEDAAAPVAAGPLAPPPSNLLPPPGTQPAAACPNGQCIPLNTIDPNLINTRTRVLINITPQ